MTINYPKFVVGQMVEWTTNLRLHRYIDYQYHEFIVKDVIRYKNYENDDAYNYLIVLCHEGRLVEFWCEETELKLICSNTDKGMTILNNIKILK